MEPNYYQSLINQFTKNASHELLYIKSYSSYFSFPCRDSAGVLAGK